MLEREYEQCKKYDDPNYTGQVLELKGHFENNEKGAIEFDDAQKEVIYYIYTYIYIYVYFI